MIAHLRGFLAELMAWWNSDKLSSKTVRIPLKLAIVGALAVTALAVGLYGAGKLRDYADNVTPATAAQLAEYRNQIIAACAPPKVEPAKKSKR